MDAFNTASDVRINSLEFLFNPIAAMLQGFSSLTEAFAISVKHPAAFPMNSSMMQQLHMPSTKIRVSLNDHGIAQNASSPAGSITPEPTMKHNLLPAISLGLVLLAILGLSSLAARRRRTIGKRGLQGSLSGLLKGSRAHSVVEPIVVRRTKSMPYQVEAHKKREFPMNAITIAR